MSLENKEQYVASQKILEFVDVFINNLDKYFDTEDFSNFSEFTAYHLRLIAKLSTNFKIDINPKFLFLKQYVI